MSSYVLALFRCRLDFYLFNRVFDGGIMNLSQYLKRLLFVAFSLSFDVTSWPTYISMSCEVTLKYRKNSFKNQLFSNSGVGS